MHTPEIMLLPVLPSHKAALAEHRERLGAALNLRVPEGWPQFPEAFDPLNKTGSAEWPSYFFVSTSHQSIVGNGGFVGPPIEGQVEIGYEVAPEFQNKGFATSAVHMLLRKAFQSASVQSVIAHTLAEHNASNAVLLKAGMSFVAELPSEEVGKVWQWRISRPPRA